MKTRVLSSSRGSKVFPEESYFFIGLLIKGSACLLTRHLVPDHQNGISAESRNY